MKILKGFRIATNPDTEIGILRHYEFRKAYALMVYNLNEFDFGKILYQYNEATDIDKKVIFNNFAQSLLISKHNYNAYLECFKLICLEDGEDIHSIDELYLNQKLIRISKAGILPSEIEFEVENFSKALPALKSLKGNQMLAMKNLQGLIKK
jgi:hypothetical protein